MNPKPPQGPPITPPSNEEGPKILTFEEFSYREPRYNIPRYNNFFLQFGSGDLVEIAYRQTPHFKKFKSEHNDMFESLCNNIQNRDQSKGTSESLKLFDRNLYEAYKIMRGYGVSDRDLFA